MNKQALSAYGAALRDKLDGDMLRGLVDPRTIQPRHVPGDKFAPVKTVEHSQIVKRAEVVVSTEVVRKSIQTGNTTRIDFQRPGI